MLWQDLVLTGGSVIFAAALVPSVVSANKPAFWTSLSTAVVLVVFAGVYVSLSLWFSSVITFITALLWFTLSFQKLRMEKKSF